MRKEYRKKETEEAIKNRIKRKSPIVMILFILLIGIIVFFVIKRVMMKEDIEVKNVPRVKVTKMYEGNIEKKASVIGVIQPGSTYYVVPKVSGEITKIYVENGDNVKKDDKICEIDNSKQIEALKIQLDATTSAYNRIVKLYNAGDVSKQDYESAKAQYDGAKLSYDTQVEFATVLAPGDGIIENKNMTENTMASQGTVLCYVTSLGAKDISFGVTERIISGIQIGDNVTIEKNNKEYIATIYDKSNLISQSTGLFPIKATIISENNFSSGITAKVNVSYLKKEKIQKITRNIVYYENEKPYVFIVNDENKIKKVFIETGIENDTEIEIISGINKNDRLLLTWSSDIQNDIDVVVVE
ncbi:MAG: efflux RND transporter periplasmic adaptor subunit [Eubacteriales bacterium]|nr:efflux RND transporter periplasmic adaptor subunit [Eubacteriales bacterium]